MSRLNSSKNKFFLRHGVSKRKKIVSLAKNRPDTNSFDKPVPGPSGHLMKGKKREQQAEPKIVSKSLPPKIRVKQFFVR